jgi:hypothetical protein
MNLIVEFNKPYSFEGKEHEKVDLTGLESLKGKDLIDADKIFQKSGQFEPVKEMSAAYTFILASRASELPVEFFENLPIKESAKIKNMVAGFLFEVE